MCSRALFLVAAIGIAGVLAACGGGGGATSDAEIARGSALRLADLPGSWKVDEVSGEETSECAGIEAAKRLISARVRSPAFRRDEVTLASGTVYVFPDEGTAATAFRSLTSQATRQCVAHGLKEGLEQSSTVRFGKPRTAPLDIGSLGDDRVGGRITIPASAGGIDLRLYIDVVFVRVHRGVQIGMFSSAPHPFDEALRSQVTDVTMRRLASSLTA